MAMVQGDKVPRDFAKSEAVGSRRFFVNQAVQFRLGGLDFCSAQSI